MNKWLTEIEITASKRFFGKKEVRKFVDETRPLIEGVYKKLNRNVKSRYGKIVIVLWPQSIIKEYELPLHEYDNTNGVCVINVPYDFNIYLSENNKSIKNKVVFNILKKALQDVPNETGLERDLIVNILTDVHETLP